MVGNNIIKVRLCELFVRNSRLVYRSRSKIRVGEVCPRQVGLPKVRPRQVGVREVRPRQVGKVEVRLRQVGKVEVRLRQVSNS